MSRQDRWSWFSSQQQKQRRLKSTSHAPGRGIAQSRLLHVEALEDRRMLAVITVTSPADNLLSDGEISLREAIQASNTNTSVDGSVAGSGADTILFDAALSGDTITLGGTELEITEALTIDATALAENVTVDANGGSRIFNITATSGDFTLAGLTLTGGRTTGNNPLFDTTFNGGGIRSTTTGSFTIDQSTISGNRTTGVRAHGGGIFSSGGITLTNSNISENSTAGKFARGGGINSAGRITLTSSTIIGNRTAGSGGGFFSSSNVMLTSSTISGNIAESGSDALGGGIYSQGTATLFRTSVSENSATIGGGGIFSFGTVTLFSSSVSGNSSDDSYSHGGGISSVGFVLLFSSTVSGNSTTGHNSHGGGIRSFSAVKLISSTVSGNSTLGSSADGGGIHSQGTIKIMNSTVTDNHANHSDATGGGIWNKNDTITITNSIVAGNTAGGGSPDISPGTGILAIDFSLLGTAVSPDPGGTGNLLNDIPLLGPLADNGGPTETHAPLPDSPVVDAGDPFIAAPPDFDQRGTPFARVAGGRIDIGAIEDQPIASSADFDTDGDIDGADFLAWQRGFGTIYDATALATWETTYGGVPLVGLSALESGQSAVGSRQKVPANLIDAALAIELIRGAEAEVATALDEEPAFVAMDADHAFAAEAIAPVVAFAIENEQTDANSSEDDIAKTPWLADELLERVFG